MYKLIVCLRYLRGRLITVCSILFVATGVMALIVVNSVMGGFQKEFKARLRGTLSHMTVAIYEPKDYDRVARKLEATPHVKAIAPRKEGLVLLACQGEITGCRILGIDPRREFAVGQLRSYLMTPYRRLRDELLQVVERKGHEIRWELLGILPHEGQTVLYILEKVADPRGDPAIQPRHFTEMKTLSLDREGKVTFIQYRLDRRQRPADLVTSGKDFERWKKWTEEATRHVAARDVDWVLSNFRQDVTNNQRPLDPERIFEVDGGRVPKRFPGILVGNELYKAFRLRPGTEVELISGKLDPVKGEVIQVGQRFTVTGAFKTGMNEYDSNFIYAPYDAMVKFLEPRRGNLISVALDDYRHSEEVKDLLQKTLPHDTLVETWEDKRRNLLQAVHLERRIMFVILFFFILFAVVTIAVILILLVVEKLRDIGILKSMGATSWGIAAIFIANGLVAGTIGCVLGVLSGVYIAVYVNEIADWLYYHTGFRVFPRDVYYLDRIPTDVDPAWVVATVGVALGLCFLCCLFPAFKAGRLDVVETLKWE